MNYCFRGDRDFYDVTVDELQEAVTILATFYGKMYETVNDFGNDDEPLVYNERVRTPYIRAAYYEAKTDIELLRLKIQQRKDADPTKAAE